MPPPVPIKQDWDDAACSSNAKSTNDSTPAINGTESTPDRLADLILKYAKNEGATDDVSVLIVRVEAA